jgi:ribosomal protein L25 (general stress protein Ctc)
MKQQLKLNVTPRAQTGRSSSRRLRKANQVPAILYGKHTKPRVPRASMAPEFIRLVKSVAGRAVLIELERGRTRPTRPFPFCRKSSATRSRTATCTSTFRR